jgi:phosphoglycolate phosphatase
MKYRLAAFDFDGTLADSLGWFAGVWDEVAARYGFLPLPAAGAEASAAACDAREVMRRLRVPAWRLPWIAAHVRRLQARDIDRINLFPGAADLLGGLANAGVVVAIVSSNAEANVRHVLGSTTAGRVAHYGCGASLFGKPAKLRAVLRAAGVRPADAIYVGDEVRDVRAAARVGMASGGVTWGYAAPAALLANRPTEVFASPAEVLDRLTRSGV